MVVVGGSVVVVGGSVVVVVGGSVVVVVAGAVGGVVVGVVARVVVVAPPDLAGVVVAVERAGVVVVGVGKKTELGSVETWGDFGLNGTVDVVFVLGAMVVDVDGGRATFGPVVVVVLCFVAGRRAAVSPTW